MVYVNYNNNGMPFIIKIPFFGCTHLTFIESFACFFVGNERLSYHNSDGLKAQLAALENAIPPQQAADQIMASIKVRPFNDEATTLYLFLFPFQYFYSFIYHTTDHHTNHSYECLFYAHLITDVRSCCSFGASSIGRGPLQCTNRE
jgi:hypothetical protein